jgi:mono/diheme cytochrome c family protein
VLATNLKVVAIAVLVVGFYTLIAHSIPQLESEVPETVAVGSDVTPDELVRIGERTYNGSGGCTACHGLGTRAPNLLTDAEGLGPIGARCGERKSEMDCKAYLHESLTNPGAFVVPGFENIMPDMRRQLPEAQIWAVIAYLEAQGGTVTVTGADIPAAEATGATDATESGRGGMARSSEPPQLLQELGCLGCHQLDGQGPPIGPSFDGIGSRITPERIRRGILDPAAEVANGFEQFAGVMPPGFGDRMTAAQLEAILRFLAGRK